VDTILEKTLIKPHNKLKIAGTATKHLCMTGKYIMLDYTTSFLNTLMTSGQAVTYLWLAAMAGPFI
jgi:hypothetical protein